jgi:hypothetical protein
MLKSWTVVISLDHGREMVFVVFDITIIKKVESTREKKILTNVVLQTRDV